MKFLLMFFVLFALPVSALEVSVTGGQARINATIKALQTKIVTLEASVKAQGDLTTSMNKCAGQKKLYDAVAISPSNPDGCTAPPIDPDALAEELSCESGEALKFMDGSLQCINQMQGCQRLMTEVKSVTLYRNDGIVRPCKDKVLSSSISSNVVILGEYLNGKWVDNNFQSKPDVITFPNSYNIGRSSVAYAVISSCTDLGMYKPFGNRGLTGRLEVLYTASNERVECK